MTLAEARRQIAADIPLRPFSTSPFLCAIDLFSWEWKHPLRQIPLVDVSGTSDLKSLVAAAVAATRKKSTLKVKLTGNPKTDIAGLRALEGVAGIASIRLRADANQGYGIDDAEVVFSCFRDSKTLSAWDYVEQPLAIEDWTGTAKLRRLYPTVPIMLDEGIITDEDIRKARETDVAFIKLKLFKQGGIHETISQARLARSLGLKVVLGNGVATQISNDIELKIHSEHWEWFYGASEANGFLKVSEPGAPIAHRIRA
jgi:L-alanine-DL-glutamate epimerase-like enolase superfamily enzyme